MTSFRSSATSEAETITAPSDIVEGDLLVLFDRAWNFAGGEPTTVVPSGWSSAVVTAGTTSNRLKHIISYKIADGSEASATITGMTASDRIRKILAVFDAAAVSVAATFDPGEVTDGNPASQSALAGTNGTAPLIVLGGFGSDGGTFSQTFSPAPDDTLHLSSSNNHLYLAYKIYDSSPSDTTVDMADEGAGNGLQSGYIELSAATNTPQAVDVGVAASAAISAAVSKAISAALSGAASILATKTFLRLVAAGVTTSASLTRATSKGVAAVLSSAASLARAVSMAIGASVDATGAVQRHFVWLVTAGITTGVFVGRSFALVVLAGIAASISFGSLAITKVVAVTAKWRVVAALQRVVRSLRPIGGPSGQLRDASGDGGDGIRPIDPPSGPNMREP